MSLLRPAARCPPASAPRPRTTRNDTKATGHNLLTQPVEASSRSRENTHSRPKSWPISEAVACVSMRDAFASGEPTRPEALRVPGPTSLPRRSKLSSWRCGRWPSATAKDRKSPRPWGWQGCGKSACCSLAQTDCRSKGSKLTNNLGRNSSRAKSPSIISLNQSHASYTGLPWRAVVTSKTRTAAPKAQICRGFYSTHSAPEARATLQACQAKSKPL